jgi:hypothetical protein
MQTRQSGAHFACAATACLVGQLAGDFKQLLLCCPAAVVTLKDTCSEIFESLLHMTVFWDQGNVSAAYVALVQRTVMPSRD